MVRDALPPRTARLRRAQLLLGRGRTDDARAAVREAFGAEGGRSDPEILLTGAALELQASQASSGDLSPDDAAARRAAAAEYLAAAAELDPPDPRLLLTAAEYELAGGYDAGAADRAGDALRTALERLAALRDAADTPPAVRATLLRTEWLARTRLAELVLAAAAAGAVPVEEAGAEVERQVAGMRELGDFAEAVDLLRGRLALQSGDPAAAAPLLERARAGLADGAVRVDDRATLDVGRDALAQVDLYRAAAYRELGNAERATAILTQMLRDYPERAEVRLQLAGLLTAAGRTDDALTVLRPVGGSPGGAVAYAALLVRQAVAKPGDAAAATRADAAVDRLAGLTAPETSGGGDGALLPVLLRAELRAAAGEFAAAADLLDGALADAGDGTAAALWPARLNLAAVRTDLPAGERAANADRLLQRARERLGDGAAVRRAAVVAAGLRGDDAAATAVRDAVAAAGDLPPAERTALRLALVPLAAERGLAEAVRALWADLAGDAPAAVPAGTRLAARTAAATFAAAETGPGSDDRFAAALAAVRESEGPDGPTGNRLAAARTVALAAADPSAATDSALSAAARRLDAALARRPTWPAAAATRGRLELVRGNDGAALEWFLRARTWGDRTDATLSQTVNLLLAAGRTGEADVLLKTAGRDAPGGLSGTLARQAWAVSDDLGEVDRLVELSGRLADTSDDPADRVRRAYSLGRQFLALPPERRDAPEGRELAGEADAKYRAALADRPDDLGTWTAFVRFLAASGRADAAAAAVAEAEAAIPADRPAPLRLAQAAGLRELLGRYGEAADFYRRAAAADADAGGADGRFAAADFFLRAGATAEARDLLLELDDALPGLAGANADRIAGWVRPRAAVARAVGARWADVGPALAALRGDRRPDADALRQELTLIAGPESRPYRLLRIDRLGLLARRGGLSAGERLQFAGLLEAEGRWPEAKALLEALAADLPDAAEPVVALVRGAVRRESTLADGLPTLTPGAADRVRPLADRLRGLPDPGPSELLASAEFAAAAGDRAAAAERLRALAGGPADPAGAADRGTDEPPSAPPRLAAAARAAERLGIKDLADELYAKLAEAGGPADGLQRAAYLGRTGRFAAALDAVERLRDPADPTPAALTAVAAISLGRVPAAQLDRAETIVRSALRDDPESDRLRKALAGLLFVRGNTGAAEPLYAELIRESPNDTDLLNNRAWLLASAGDRTGESSRLLDRAEAVDGPTVNLLDTRATASVLLGENPDDAVAALAELAGVTENATILLHLAAARRAAGRTDWRDALRRSLAAGASFDTLHPSEHDLLRGLLADGGSIQ